MIGVKVDIKAYQKTGNAKKKNVFSIEETLLTHYDTISKDAKKNFVVNIKTEYILKVSSKSS